MPKQVKTIVPLGNFKMKRLAGLPGRAGRRMARTATVSISSMRYSDRAVPLGLHGSGKCRRSPVIDRVSLNNGDAVQVFRQIFQGFGILVIEPQGGSLDVTPIPPPRQW